MSEYRDLDHLSSDQQILAGRLKDGGLSVAEFLTEVHNLDQRTPERADADNNIALLTEPEIKSMILASEHDRDEYYNLLSLSYLHVGQRLGVHNPLARTQFELALAAVTEIQDTDFTDWKLYIEAHVAYFAHDTDRLREILSGLNGENRVIVENMLKSL